MPHPPSQRRRSRLITPPLLLLLTLSAACDSQPSSPTPTPTTPPPVEVLEPVALTPPDPTSAESLGLFYCAHTQGPVPNWLLASDLAPFLVPADADTARLIGGDTLQAFALQHQPRHLAFARFLTRNTRCTVRRTRLIPDPDNEPNVELIVDQSVPLLDDPQTPLDLPDDPEAQQHVWLKSFESAFTGTFRDDSFRITLIPQKDGTFLIDARLDARYGELYRAEEALKRLTRAVQAHDWPRALEDLDAACAHPSTRDACTTQRKTLEAGRASAAKLNTTRDALVVENTRLRGVAQSSGSVLRVLTVTVRNPTDTPLHGVWVHATWPKDGSLYCALQNAMPPGDTQPLHLPPHTIRDGYCRIPSTPDAIRDPVTRILDVGAEEH